jgi:glycosyltransferase involved in cell wall biosynthesis
VGLTVVGECVEAVQWRVPEEVLVQLMNSHFCHIMPSAYEGYGQVLHEAQSAGQVIITTDAPPMNELTPAILVPSLSMTKHHDGMLHKVSHLAIARAIREVLEMPAEDVRQHQEEGRAQYVRQTQCFQAALTALVGKAS